MKTRRMFRSSRIILTLRKIVINRLRGNSQLVNRILVQVNQVVQAKIDQNHLAARKTLQAKTKVSNMQLLVKQKSVNLSGRNQNSTALASK